MMDQAFHVGNWLVRPQLSRIQRGEEEFQVELKAMEVLLYLAQHSDEVVLKERLMQGVWPDTFVTDAVLTHAISELRRAFQDDARNPRVIETLPRRGYRLIAPVRAIAPEESSARFELREKIGSGAMGEVYLAEDTILDRPVALKFLLEELAQDETARKRLLREARAAAALDHPFICKIYDTGELEGRTFIAMEYVKGESLKQRLVRGPIPLKDAVRITAQVAEGLETAAEKRIVHRDIKPSNIILTHQGRVKITDFGIARRLPGEAGGAGEDQSWTATLTEDVTPRGTLPYMSPEQIQGRPLDHRSDLFSLGVVFYEMVTGLNPFRRPEKMATANAVLSHPPPELRACMPAIPKGLEGIIRRMLAKDPDGRYQSFHELRVDLGQIMSGAASGYFSSRVGLHRRIGATVAGLGIGLFVIWGYFSAREPELSPATQEAVSLQRAIPLTSEPGREFHPRFSPDGNHIAYVKELDDGKTEIRVQAVGGRQFLRLTSGVERDVHPVWAPDAARIAFFRIAGDDSGIFVVEPWGGPEQKLIPVEHASDMQWGGNSLSWSSDGKFIAFSESDRPGETYHISLFSLSARVKQPLTAPPPGSGFGDRWAEFSPDSQQLVFVRNSDAFTVSVGRGEPQHVTENVFSSAWMPEGREIVFSGHEAAWYSPGLWRVPISGGTPRRIVAAGSDAFHPTVAARGNRLAFTRRTLDQDILRLDLQSGEQAAPLVASTFEDAQPHISPDGTRVVFASNRGGDIQIWVCGSDGSNPQPLTDLPSPAADPVWSPNGEHIAFNMSTKEGRSDIWVVGSEGGPARRLTTDSAVDVWPRWSRDGRWIYFRSMRTGRNEIWRVQAQGNAAPVLMTKNGGWSCEESLDGRFLYFSKPGEGLWRMPAAGGQAVLVLGGDFLNVYNWCVGEKGIYILDRKAKPLPSIQLLDPETGKLEQVAELDKQTAIRGGGGRWLSISPRDEWLLYDRSTIQEDIMLVENFR